MKISAIICTRNRPEDVEWALPSLLRNRYEDYEVVVVDQSDGAATRQIVASHQRHSANLRYVPTETEGLSRARNLGVAVARGELIAFTDDDCVIGEDWIATIVRLFSDSLEVDMIYGQVHMPDDLPGEDLAVPCLYFTTRRLLRQGNIFGMGANMAFRRTLFEQIGGYDPLLGAGGDFPGGEDFDFQYRAQRSGATLIAEPTLVLIHRAYRTRAQWQRVLRSYGMGDAAFYAKHLRCGDLWAAGKLMKELTWSTARAARAVLLRRPPETAYFQGVLWGLRRSWVRPIDGRRRLYLDPAVAEPRVEAPGPDVEPPAHDSESAYTSDGLAVSAQRDLNRGSNGSFLSGRPSSTS